MKNSITPLLLTPKGEPNREVRSHLPIWFSFKGIVEFIKDSVSKVRSHLPIWSPFRGQGLLATCLLALVLTWTSCERYPYQQGQILYHNFCENCHMADGSGLANLIPPLAGADYLALNGSAVPCIIRSGIQGEMTVNGKKYTTEMVGIEKLTEFEITNIINYIHTSWGNNLPVVEHPQVREWLKPCEKNTKPF